MSNLFFLYFIFKIYLVLYFSVLIWLGDLNYRVNLDFNTVLKYIKNENYDKLLSYDQVSVLYDLIHILFIFLIFFPS